MSSNKNDSQMQSEISFLNLIENKKILIPKIQRDYAQGRLDRKATEIRDGFLSAIIESLTSNDDKPLLLDFIYGSTHNNQENHDFPFFTPLDGQQRLTTLFLLHWYLIPKDKLSLLTIVNKNSIYSRFSYETRISSKDFCNALVDCSVIDLKNELNIQREDIEKEIQETENKIQEIENKKIEDKKESDKKDIDNYSINIKQLQALKKKGCLSNTIINQPWFLWSWKKDPTIKAIMVMLDEMDLRIGNQNENISEFMWKQLKNNKIVFHLLPLEQFTLTDELYVKMNARGKELSSFDIFKSTLEEQMRINEVNEKIQNKWRNNLDSNWIDLFWNKLAKPNINANINTEDQKLCVESVEEGYLRFLKRMMEFHLFMNDDCFECDWSDEKIKRYVPFEYDMKNVLDKLRDFSVRNDVLLLMPLFCKTKFFNVKFFQFIIKSFDSLIYILNGNKHDGSSLLVDLYFENGEKSIFEAFIAEDIDYENKVQFFALLKYFEFNTANSVFNNGELKVELNSWMRIIRNLSTNTNNYFYNGYDDFLKSLKAIEKWGKEVYNNGHNLSIINYFIEQTNLDGFNSEQLKEEKSKAVLINESGDWRKLIREAEEHKYFLGQIRFLLEWTLNNGSYKIESFKEYFDKIVFVFVENGLNSNISENHIFRNTMMTISDWYLFNNCFMQNTSKSRDWSWKRYLRESSKSINIKTLLDSWDKTIDFQIFCSDRIMKYKPSDWRKYFIEKPEIYNELFDHKISWWNWENTEICLLSKTRWSSKHKELYTFYLHLKYKNLVDVYLDSTNEMNPFSAIFKRDSDKEFSVKFLPEWNTEWVKGKYLVSADFNMQLIGMQYNIDNSRWEQYFDSSNYQEVEDLIFKLDTCKK